jgi:DnaJ-class molecular chaperone
MTDRTIQLLIRLAAALGVVAVFHGYNTRFKRVLSRKRQRQALRIVEALKDRGHHAEVCPECEGKGQTHYFSWRLDKARDCPKCDGMGYIYEIKGEKEEHLA